MTTNDPTGPRLSPEQLRTLFLFEALDPDQLAWLSERGRCEDRWAGEAVYTQGEEATCFFVLLSGALTMRRRVEDTPRPPSEPPPRCGSGSPRCAGSWHTSQAPTSTPKHWWR